jgi:hypothetical protein
MASGSHIHGPYVGRYRFGALVATEWLPIASRVDDSFARPWCYGLEVRVSFQSKIRSRS